MKKHRKNVAAREMSELKSVLGQNLSRQMKTQAPVTEVSIMR